MTYALNRLKERSTWLGLIAIATGSGAALSPDLINTIITVGTLAAGTIAAATKG